MVSPSIDAQIVINEFDIDSSPQTVELFNSSDNQVDISGWYLDDSGGASYLTIPNQTQIEPNACILVQGNLYLNSATPDTIRLFTHVAPPTQTGVALLVDSYSYTHSPAVNTNYSRIPDGSGSFEEYRKSMGQYNISGVSCVNVVSSPSPTPINETTPTSIETPIPTSQPTSPSPTPSPHPSLPPTPEPSTGDTPSPTGNPIPTPTPTPTPPRLIFISEVLPNPQSGSEWIEIYNHLSSNNLLQNWILRSGIHSEISPMLVNMTIPAQGYGVVELGSSFMNDTGDTIELFDQNGNMIETFTYTASEVDISWGRTSIENDIFCLQVPSKGIVNNSCITPTNIPSSTPSPSPLPIHSPSPTSTVTVPTPTRTPTYSPTPRVTTSPSPTHTPTSTPTPTPIPPDHVYLHELFVNPEDGEDEWIELYNDNRFSIQLTEWSVRDATGNDIAQINSTIEAYGYAVIPLASARMNNTDETIELINNGGEIEDSFVYETSTRGMSWGRSPATFSTWCMQTPSQGTYNNSCSNSPTPTPQDTVDLTNTPTPSRTPSPSRTLTPSRTPTPIRTGTPTIHVTPTPRMSYGALETDASGGLVLGESTHSASPFESINFTPSRNNTPKPSYAFSTQTSDELPEYSADQSDEQPYTIPLVLYCLVGISCMMFCGTQLIQIWNIYKDTFNEFPEQFG